MGVVMLSESGTSAFFERIEAALQRAGIVPRHIRHTTGDTIPASALADADVLLAYGHFRCTETVMRAAPRLRAVVSPWVGTDGFDVDAATRLGIAVVNGQPDEHTQGMAEATVMMILAASYGLPQARHTMESGGARPAEPVAELLAGKTLGIIGLGQIGRRVAALLAHWDISLKAHDPFAREVPDGIELLPLDELLQASDIVTLHMVLTEQTRHLIDAARLRLMKPDAILINTARGGLIDEIALFDAMSSGHLRGAALDVFEIEPLPMDSALRKLPNILLTPHMIGQTKQSRAALVDLAVANVSALMSGTLPKNLRNRTVSETWHTRWASS
ncbi:2-hydroxyacid dehydrogenase [Devosia ginsengisoli]|uniref:2-hydroxyacid dehydrogenase n=1 Tax=Devosia ginsengisoli TaxID=400770 RepID=UPI0026F26B85|nr:2-hydroxyacid dehydrogenase [Devosia ginsengisoli]MCR6670726.1 2-hydroxyacid dehydrogenase [Devosia ginsengisoli]